MVALTRKILFRTFVVVFVPLREFVCSIKCLYVLEHFFFPRKLSLEISLLAADHPFLEGSNIGKSAFFLLLSLSLSLSISLSLSLSSAATSLGSTPLNHLHPGHPLALLPLILTSLFPSQSPFFLPSMFSFPASLPLSSPRNLLCTPPSCSLSSDFPSLCFPCFPASYSYFPPSSYPSSYLPSCLTHHPPRSRPAPSELSLTVLMLFVVVAESEPSKSSFR